PGRTACPRPDGRPPAARQLMPETTMAAVENTVTIMRPVEEVFAYLADAENLPRWNYAIEQTKKITAGPVGVGTAYRQTPTIPTRSQEEFEIVVSQPPGQLVLDGTFGPFRVRTSYLLEPVAGGTVLTNRWELEATSAPLRLLAPVAIPQVKAAVAKNLRTLRQILENARAVPGQIRWLPAPPHAVLSWLGEGFGEGTGGQVGGCFGDEVPGGDASAAHLAGPGLPYLQRPVPAGDRAGLTPEHQRRAGDPAPSAVGLVMLVIEGGGGAVLLADGMDPAGIAELAEISGADVRGEDIGPVRPRVEHVAHQHLRRPGDQLLGHRAGGRQERPDPEPEAKVHVRPAERLPGGDDVEHREAGHGGRVVQRHPVGAPCPAVVPGHGEGAVAQRVHALDLVAGGLAHAVRRVIGGAGRRAAGTEPAQVGGDHGEPFGEPGRDPVPHQMRFRDAVQQQDRRPLPAPAAVDRRARGRDIEFL